MKVSGIYEIRHTGTGRVYVGQSVDIDARWKEHRRRLARGTPVTPLLLGAWLMYGSDEFVFTVLEEVADFTLLTACEQWWIDTLKAADPAFGFNTAPAAGSSLGRKASAMTRARIRAANMQRPPRSAESRAKISAILTGKVTPAAVRAKLSLAGMGNQNARGWRHTEITRPKALAALAKARRARWPAAL